MTMLTIPKERALNSSAFTHLQRRMRGELLTPSAAAYETACRMHNRRFNQRPALIARCLTTQDVALAVDFARQQDLNIAIRSGAHGGAGYDVDMDSLVIDLGGMRRIVIDPLQQVARVQPGATSGELVQAAGAHSLATTTGTCASVGMVGSTLGGGIGWLTGRFGATVDNVLAFEMVTAEGTPVTVSPVEHPDLFWALRGGGGNFGVVTAMTLQLHPLGPVLGGSLIFPVAAAPHALSMYRETTGTAPDELVIHAELRTLPGIGSALVLQAVYSREDFGRGEQLLAPLRRCGPTVDLIEPRTYDDTYMFLTPPILPDAASYDTAYSLQEPSDEALDDLLATALARPSPSATVTIHQVHGAATRVAPEDTAFAQRHPHYVVSNLGTWIDGDGAAETAWAHAAQKRMASHAAPGLHVNFLGAEGEDAVRAAYGQNYNRLAAIKAHYDPENMFRYNQNIAPRSSNN